MDGMDEVLRTITDFVLSSTCACPAAVQLLQEQQQQQHQRSDSRGIHAGDDQFLVRGCRLLTVFDEAEEDEGDEENDDDALYNSRDNEGEEEEEERNSATTATTTTRTATTKTTTTTRQFNAEVDEDSDYMEDSDEMTRMTSSQLFRVALLLAAPSTATSLPR